MNEQAREALDRLKTLLRSASIATAGGFRPPQDPLVSWFCRGVGRDGEPLPTWKGQPMFPLIQICTRELPAMPKALEGIDLLVLFHNLVEHPFDRPHGQGWLIREYRSVEGLLPLPEIKTPYRPFPIAWSRIDDDAPGWEDAWSLVDLEAVNKDEAATDCFFQDFNRYGCTKIGGYPREIQHGFGHVDGVPHDAALDWFVFQVGSEEKVNWMWADNGIGYFFRSPTGEWHWHCQFY